MSRRHVAQLFVAVSDGEYPGSENVLNVGGGNAQLEGSASAVRAAGTPLTAAWLQQPPQPACRPSGHS